jgi:hypothetical protein
MPNEFKVKNGLIVDQGGAAITGSLTVSGSQILVPITTTPQYSFIGSTNSGLSRNPDGALALQVNGTGPLLIYTDSWRFPFSSITLKDSNTGNIGLAFSAANGVSNSPTNYILIANSVTGSNPRIQPESTVLSHVSLNITAKGTGSVNFPTGSIGIGTTAPTATLHVSGASSAVLLEIDSPALNNILFVSGSGNVGIGTNTPQDRFSISGELGSTTSEMSVINTAGGKVTLRAGILGVVNSGFTLLTADANGSNENTRLVVFGSTGNVSIGSTTDSGRLAVRGSGATSSTTALRVENTNTSASLVVLDNGNVGVGTTTPSQTLTVNGNISASGNLFINTGSNQIRIGDNLNDNAFSDTFKLYNVGINGFLGTYFYNSSLELKAGASGSSFVSNWSKIEIRDNFSSTGYIRFFTSGSERARITNTGNFGIGTTSPSSTLDVSGSGRFTNGLIVTGSLIVSGPNGGIDTVNSVLTDSTTNRIEWANGTLNSSTGESINWESRILSDPSNTFVALEYSSDAYLNSQLYYRNIIPGQVQRKLAETPASYYGGQVIQATVDVGVTDFQLVFLDTDGTWKPTKATVASGASKMLGICVDQANGYVLIEGDVGVSDDNSQGAHVIGADHGLPAYVSVTTGVMTTTAPSSAGELVRIVGHIYYQSTTDANWWTMKFRPSNDWYEQ